MSFRSDKGNTVHNYKRLYASNTGAWGVIDENEFVIVSCFGWTNEDFNELDEALDSEKKDVAIRISERVTKQVLDDITL